LAKVISSSWLIMFCVFIGEKLSEKSLEVNNFFRKNRKKIFRKSLTAADFHGKAPPYPPRKSPPSGGFVKLFFELFLGTQNRGGYSTKSKCS
jgi:hypothetical protein